MTSCKTSYFLGLEWIWTSGNRQKKLEHAGVSYMQNVNAANLKACTHKV